MATGHAAATTGLFEAVGHHARLVGLVVMSLALAAAVLRTLDTVPSWLRGEPRGLRRYDRLEDLERAVRTRLLLPAYFPEGLEYPPVRILLAPGGAQPSAVAFRDRMRGTERLVVCQNARGDAPLPDRLLPPGLVLQRVATDVNGAQAVLTRMRAPDTREWTDLVWVQQGRRVALRLHGDDAELMRFARSLTRVRP